ncbi:MAG: hypothetical protein R6X15_05260 [Pseudomonadota bacterium]
MTTTRFVIVLTGWLMAGFIANYLDWIEPDGASIGWWLMMGIPGGLYAALLLGSFAFSVIALFLALLAPRSSGRQGR